MWFNIIWHQGLIIYVIHTAGYSAATGIFSESSGTWLMFYDSWEIHKVLPAPLGTLNTFKHQTLQIWAKVCWSQAESFTDFAWLH